MSGFGFGPGFAGSLPSVARFADLPATADPLATCWVTNRGVQYVYTGGSPAWRPTVVTDPRNANATYYVASTGSSDGLGTSGDPLSSIADVVQRIGLNPVGQVFVNLLGPLNENETIINLNCAPDLLHFIIISGAGARTTSLTTTLSGGVTAWTQNASTNTVGTIAGASSLTAYGGAAKKAGRHFRISGGARDGALGVLGAVESGSNVLFVPPQLGLYTAGSVVPQTSDTVEILAAPPKLTSKLTVSGGLLLGLDNVTVGDVGDSHGVLVAQSIAKLSACLVNCGVDVAQNGSLEGIACAFDDTVRTYGDGDGGDGSWNFYGCHTQAIEGRKLGKLDFADTYARGAIALSQGSVSQVPSGILYVDTPGGGTALTMGQKAALDIVGVLNGRGITASPGVLVLGNDAGIAYAVKPNFTGGSGDLWVFDASNHGAAAALPAAHPTNGAKIQPRTY